MAPAYVTAGRLDDLGGLLSERDLAIITTVDTVRVVTGQQLQRLHFDPGPSGARHCRRVLAALVERRLLARLERRIGGVRTGSSGYVYALDIAGQALVTAPGVRRRPWTPGRSFLAHSLAITEVYVRLVEAAQQNTIELLGFQTEPRCWRPFAGTGGGRLILKPDAMVRTAVGEYEDAWFIEVDRSTESPTTLTRKFDLYRRYWSSGREQRSSGVFPRVLWLAPDPARVEVLLTIIDRQPRNARPLFVAAEFDQLVTVMSAEAE